MEIDKIKKHLKPYSISGKRKSTINHAFASALAINDEYLEERVRKALEILEVIIDGKLFCFYCDTNEATTWDHVVSLVKNREFQGYGHQIGNLIPSCSTCNSKKGGKEWGTFLESKFTGGVLLNKKQKLQEYINKNVTNTLPIINMFTEELEEYRKIKEEIFKKLEEADAVAERIRKKVINKLNE
ncbi:MULTISPECIES: HNH endonuclease [Priestia]|uniref:HNH endonuclease n=1 Tax=Priestia TaxID=2800373 RepID=UPI000BFBD989|nr:HNH endonuclease [Priestia aryabhattai]PHF65978.1 hypothetical protein COI42_23085 [Priestia aryabhattai]